MRALRYTYILLHIAAHIGSISGKEGFLRICIFQNHRPDSMEISAIDTGILLNGENIIPGDTVRLYKGMPILVEGIGFFAISNYRVWRMLCGRLSGTIGGDIFCDMPLENWVLLALLGEFPGEFHYEA